MPDPTPQTPPQATPAPGATPPATPPAPGVTPPVTPPVANTPADAGGEKTPPPTNQPPLDDSHIQSMIDGSYGKFQSKVDTISNELSNAKKENKTLSDKLGKIENADQLIADADKAKEVILQAEVGKLRDQLVDREFPALKGKEQYVTGNTLEDMRASAAKVMQDFGIAGDGTPTSLNTPAAPTGGIDPSGLASMSDDERAKVIKGMSDEDLARMTGNPVPKKPAA